MKLGLTNKATLIKIGSLVSVALTVAVTVNVTRYVDRHNEAVTVNYFEPSPEDQGEFVLLKRRIFDESVGDSVTTFTVLRAADGMLEIPIGGGKTIKVFAPIHKKGLRR